MIDRIIFDNVNLHSFEGAPPAGAPSKIWNSIVEFKKGNSYLIEASSGRGKSSFCSFIYGLRNDYSGRILFAKETGGVVDVKSFDSVVVRRCSLAVMFQDMKLFPELTAVDNVMLKNQLTTYTTENDVRAMLVRLGLEKHLERPCAKMSIGQQQRVAFVRALCQPADFIILDEPISHLDEENANIVAQMLRERQQKDSIGIIVTSIGYRLPYDYDAVLSL